MKDTQGGTLHIYEPAWLSQEGCSFVECDASGNYLNAIDDNDWSLVDTGRTKPKTKTKADLAVSAELSVAEAIAAAEAALSADASNI